MRGSAARAANDSARAKTRSFPLIKACLAEMMTAIGNTRIFGLGGFKTDVARFLVEIAHGFVRLRVVANTRMSARANGNMRIERFVVVISPGIFFLGIAIDDALIEFGFHQIRKLERQVQFREVHRAVVFRFRVRRTGGILEAERGRSLETRRSLETVVLRALDVFTEEGAAKMIASPTHLFHKT